MTRKGNFEQFLAWLRLFFGFHCFCFHCQDFGWFLLNPPRSCLARGVITYVTQIFTGLIGFACDVQLAHWVACEFKVSPWFGDRGLGLDLDDFGFDALIRIFSKALFVYTDQENIGLLHVCFVCATLCLCDSHFRSRNDYKHTKHLRAFSECGQLSCFVWKLCGHTYDS